MSWLYDLDQTGFRAIHLGLHSDWVTPLFAVLSYSGLGQVQALFALVLLKWQETRRFTEPLIVTIIVAGLPIAQGIKKLLPRERPSRLLVSIPQEDWRDNSFLSGHTCTSFGIATMVLLLTWRTKNERYGWLMMIWAACVGVSRIYRGVHWPTDVVAGAFGGVAGACLVYLAYFWIGGSDRILVPEPETTPSELAA